MRSAHRLVVALAALVALMFATVAPAAPPGSIPLGATYSNVNPDVLVDRAGNTHVAYIRRVEVPAVSYELHYSRRAAGPATFADRVLPGFAAGTEFASVALVEDTVANRLLLFVGTSPSGSSPLGAWVLASSDGGVTWSQPARIWDSFFVGDSFALRPTDGSFGMVPKQTGVLRLIIPPGLPFQPREGFFFASPAGTISRLSLSDRIVSRSEVNQAFGPDGRSYTMFEAIGAGWVHVGGTASANDYAEFGQLADKQVATGDLDLEIAGGADGAGILSTQRFGDGPATFYRLSGAGIAGSTVIPLAPGQTRAFFPQLITAPDGTFYAIYRVSGGAEGIVLRRSEDFGVTWSADRAVVSAAESELSTELAAYSSWSVGGPTGAQGALVYNDPASKQATALLFDPKSEPLRLALFQSPRSVTLGAFTTTGALLRVSLNRAGTLTVTVVSGKRTILTRRLALKRGPNGIRLKARAKGLKRGTYRLVLTGPGIRRSVTLGVK